VADGGAALRDLHAPPGHLVAQALDVSLAQRGRVVAAATRCEADQIADRLGRPEGLDM